MKFDLASVLSITTTKLLCDMDMVHKILDYMTSDNLFVHQLPRAAVLCHPILLKQFPELSEIDADEITPENWQDKLEEYKQRYGNEFDVVSISDGYEPKDPILEAVEMIGKAIEK